MHLGKENCALSMSPDAEAASLYAVRVESTQDF